MAGVSSRTQLICRRALLVGGVQVGLIGVLAGRLVQLQVVEGERYSRRAEDNRTAERPLAPERGEILDRRGRPLARNRETYRLLLVPEKVGPIDVALDEIGRLATLGPTARERVRRLVRKQPGFEPVVVLDDMSWEEMARLSLAIAEREGIFTNAAQRRIYPLGPAAAHAIGYVGRVSQKDLERSDSASLLRMPDFRIGKTGVERTQDETLRGAAGTRLMEITSTGRQRRELGRQEGLSGETLRLTLDAGLQRFAAGLFGKETGAAVLMDVRSGGLLATVSAPSFDPGAFHDGIADRQEWLSLAGDPLHPLSNRAVSGQYAPGSTFKIAVALAALEARVVSADQRFFCNGVHELGTGRFHCWRRGGHGHVDLFKALQQSCDIYFYEIAQRTGIDRIAAMARKLGLGAATGIELPGEHGGLIPTKAWKRKARDESWQVGETLLAGIGQGYVLATPLQLATMTARLANGAHAVLPRLIGGGNAPELEIDRRFLRVVRKGLAAVTGSRRGTAWNARIEEAGFEMAGKTGTSQVRRISRLERRLGVRKNEDLPREQRDHALFVGYAPADKPRYAAAVVVEHGGSGSKAAAPIARDLLLAAQKAETAAS
ncbi:MAG: penicillin-binding protein 2 [Alphaproteobacteria bacterium]|nr:penicillin-binding protein 2 [Alphaproteobacteria bacterium]